MGMPARRDPVWTVEMLDELPDDGNRYEIVDGELLVSPSPSRRHQLALGELFRLVGDYVRQHHIGHTFFAPLDVRFSRHRATQPDLFVEAPALEARREDRVDPGALLLAAEISSPTTARFDRKTKRPMYQDERVPEYWIVDLDARIVERWRPDDDRAEVLLERLEWQPRESVPPLVIDLDAYFATVWQE
jgi:Uma2 family endonuclease